MAEEDHIRFEATFANAEQYVNRMAAALEQEAAELRKTGETARASMREAQAGALRESVGPAREAPEIQQANAEIEREIVLKRTSLAIDYEMLQAINEQVAAMERREALLQSLQDIGAAGWRETGRQPGPGVQRAVAEQQAAADAERLAREQYINQALDAEGAGRRRLLEIQQQQVAAAQAEATALERRQAALASPARAWAAASAASEGYDVGAAAAAQGRLVPRAQRAQLMAQPDMTPIWTRADQALVRYNITLGEYDTFAANAARQTEVLTANITRQGIQENEASNAMRRHGALTTEYLQALARGETTVQEFGYQLGATVAKFAGWTAAAAATFAVLGSLTEVGKGAIDTSSAVEQLKRTIDGIDTNRASQMIQQLSQGVNVPIKEAGDAVFAFSRTFHDLPDAVAAAHDALAAFKLDGVQVADSVKAATALNQQFGVSGQSLSGVYDMLAAGQREYNARITEMIPLIQRSSGAVANASEGNRNALNELIQIGVYAQRTTQLSGSQVGTAFYRSAATFLNPTTSKGAADREVLASFGINPDQSWTRVIREALVKSVSLSSADRAQIANAIFGPQFGGRLAAIFNPQAVPQYEQIAGIRGDPRRAITPGATQGSLQRELNTQLDRTNEQIKSFVNELQRMGASIATSGLVGGLTTALRAMVTASTGLREVASAFGTLPREIRDVIVALAALGAALAFLNRTRIGSTLADVTRLSSIPGVGASELTQQRFGLRVGTRAAQEAVQADLGRTSAQLLGVSARRLALDRERALLQQVETDDAAQAERAMVRYNEISAEMAALGRQELVLQQERNAQFETLSALQAQQRNLRRSPGRLQRTDPGAYEQLYGAGGLGANVEQGTERAAGQLALFESEAAATAGASAAVTGRMAAVRAGLARAGGAVTGMATSLGSFVLGLNPLTVALVGLPFVLGELSQSADRLGQGMDAIKQSMAQPISSLAGLQSAAAELDAQSRKVQNQVDPHLTGSDFWKVPIQGYKLLADVIGGHDPGAAEVAAAQAKGRAGQLRGLAQLYSQTANAYQLDSQDLAATADGRRELSRVSQLLRTHFYRALQAQGFSGAELATLYKAYSDQLQKEYTQGITAAQARDPSSYQLDLAMPATQLAQQLQAQEDYQRIFGTNQQTMQAALTGYAAFATRAASQPNNTTLLQQVLTAQSNYANTVTKNVQDSMRAATLATTPQGQMAALNSAFGQVQTAENQVRQMMDRFKNAPKVLAALRQLMGLIAEQAQSVQQAIVQAMQSQTSLAVSAIQGVSPESDIQRQQTQVAGDLRTLATARARHFDAQTVGNLQEKLNTDRNSLLKSQIDNAKAIIDAQGKLSESAITGISPADDIARARQAVTIAQRDLAYDQAHGAGAAQIMQDQAAVYDAQRSLNETLVSQDAQIRQNAAALIDAQAQLQEARTLDPVQQAREQLGADIRILGTIKPQDYKTYTEYLTAFTQQQAKIATDTRNVTTSIVDTRMSTLQYELHTQQVTGQQYIYGLEQLLKMHGLTRQQIQSIRSAIFDEAHQEAVNLNVGSIKLPTSYEVRRAIQAAMRTAGTRIPQNTGTVVNHTVTNNIGIAVRVDRNADMKKFADTLDNALKSNFTGQAQAAGLI